ncbi:MAG: hypothetical protein KDD35_03785 [Bdellovibrionales bacterium]|nr:hypothetical protein [Bdellovibrionales bacterium]
MKRKLKKSIEDKLNSKGFEGHRPPTSRRDFVKLGLLAGGATFLPLNLFNQAIALSLKNPTIPFLVFDLAGGAALPANFLVGQEGGPEDLCKDYSQHGWNPRAPESLDKRFGIPMSKQFSKIRQGLEESLPAQLLEDSQSFIKMASYCHFSLDDTSTNRSSSLTLIAKAGLQGNFIKSGLGNRASGSGGNSESYLNDPRYIPKSISASDKMAELTSFGEEFASLSQSTKQRIFDNLKEASRDIPQLQEIYERISDKGNPEPKLNPSSNRAIQEIYAAAQNSDQEVEESAIVNCVLNGYSGPGVITIGGCDYHDNTQTTGDNKDLEIGLSIGRAISVAFSLGQPLFFQIITDGGIYAQSSQNFERVWAGDSNQHSMSVVGFFNPKGNVQLRKAQIGHYTPGGQVDQTTIIGSGPEKMAVGVLANYLYLNNLLDQFNQITGLRMKASDIEDLLVFS